MRPDSPTRPNLTRSLPPARVAAAPVQRALVDRRQIATDFVRCVSQFRIRTMAQKHPVSSAPSEQASPVVHLFSAIEGVMLVPQRKLPAFLWESNRKDSTPKCRSTNAGALAPSPKPCRLRRLIFLLAYRP